MNWESANRYREDMDRIVELLKCNPGLTHRAIAYRLELDTRFVSRILPYMEDSGIMLYEDAKGLLFYVGMRKR